MPKRTSRGPGCLEPLENGERLTAPEFLRRYEAMPRLKKAELIEGVVYMGSPVRYALHGRPDALVQLWLSHYEAHTPGVEFVANTTTQIDLDNVPQPDAMLRLREECGGQSRVDDRDYLVGAPELVVEIAASSASIDLHDKLNACRRNGVKEYLTWRTVEQQFDWRVLGEGEFRPQTTDAKGIFQSTVFPGLWLSDKALLKRDAAAVLACLETGLRSREHKAFVAELTARRSAKGKS
ncbi:MAG: Uma2 family endonuclease [Chloroflexi bacterium]|nr:Uma2 family endonuclease [Chloroflexota bacterium]